MYLEVIIVLFTAEEIVYISVSKTEMKLLYCSRITNLCDGKLFAISMWP